MNRKVLLIGAALVVPTIAILFLNLGRNPHKVVSPLVGRPMIEFKLTEVGSGQPIDLASMRGRPLVINFWATWCLPCYAEHGVLVRGARRMGSDVQFLGVVFDDEESRILRFLDQNGREYPTLVDEAGKVAIAYGVYGVPETFFVDAAGTIVAKHEGPLDDSSLAAYLATVIGGPH
ncbi:MAG TPA: redoxin domain-containing protein [Thermoanaerobaculia bacterium]|nr:redoxin domain-containing protein [Thermoanaerobaculia bacterium]